MAVTYDVAIVGGGPAGLSAAIFLGRYLHSVVLVDSGDPRNWETRGVNGYLGLPNVRPAQLRKLGRGECRRYGVEFVDGIVANAWKRAPGEFELDLVEHGTLRSRRLLLAIGLRDVWPEIPGLEKVYGRNAHVCVDCDGYEARGLKVVVLGAGRKAVGTALDLTTWTNDIIICTNGDETGIDASEYCRKLDALNIPVLTEPIVRVQPSGKRIHCLRLASGLELDADKIFFAIGQYAADDLGSQLGCRRGDAGQIVVDGHFHTSVRGVYAAGDITAGPQLAITAAAGGAIAALSIHRSLVPRERKLERRRSVTSGRRS